MRHFLVTDGTGSASKEYDFSGHETRNTHIIFLPDITAILLKFYKNKAKPFSLYKPTNMVFKKTIFHMYCLYLNLFYRPPHVSSNYHKRTVYVVSWGPQCIKTGTYTSILV